jgi:uncharacterized membrane protein YsdA (DUF1294 family)
MGQHLSFEVELNREGKKRAKNVELVRMPARATRRMHDAPAQWWSTASIVAVPLFIADYAVVAVIWRVPLWIAAAYVVGTSVCLLAYAIDNSAAVAGRWRVSEGTLLFLGLACGWPGAVLGQQLVRHKSSKASFRSAFWGTVGANVVALVAINSPLLSRFYA